MKLEFTRLTVVGFRSFNDKSTIYFEPGLHYIRGENKEEPRLSPNDVGKSTLFDALTWVLYGKTLKNLRNPDVVPWVGDEKTKVTLAFKLDNEEHKIVRTISPNNLTLDGKKIGNDDLVKLIGIDFEIFGHTVLLGQGQPLFFDKSPSEKMQVLSEVLHLEKWEERSKAASKRATELETLVSELEVRAGRIEGQLDNLKEAIARKKQLSAEWDQTQSKKMDSSQAELKGYEEQLERVMKDWGAADLAYDGAGVEVRALAGQLQKDMDANSQARLELETAQATLTKHQRDLKAMKSRRVCPTCGQAIKTDKKALTQLQRVITKGVPEELGEAAEAAHAKLANTRKDYLEFQQKESDARDQLDRLTPKKAELEAKITLLKKSRTADKEEVNPHLDELSTLRKDRTKLVADLETLEATIEKRRKAAERSQFWIKGFKDVRLFIVEELLTELEIVTNTMLDDVGLEGWSISYSVEKETKAGGVSRGLNVVVKSPRNADAVKWEVWGGGVSQRLRLVGSLALSEVLLNEASVHSNLEILDEPSRGMAAGGIDDLINTLSDRSEQTGKCILFVDHHLVKSSRFTSTIHVVKDKNGSRVL